jgi:hypothetical protein
VKGLPQCHNSVGGLQAQLAGYRDFNVSFCTRQLSSSPTSSSFSLRQSIALPSRTPSTACWLLFADDTAVKLELVDLAVVGLRIVGVRAVEY